MSFKSRIGGWNCKVCGRSFRTRAELTAHHKDSLFCKREKGQFYEPFVECECEFCGRSFNRKSAKTLHEKSCRKNPNWVKGHTTILSEAQKKKISESMKKAHAEGRAGSFPSRKNCEHSYPEKWLIGVLNKEFGWVENRDYETEYPFMKQFLDFAWPEKKLCIEIDGAQHARFQERIEADHRKDANLKSEGWKLLRLDWTYVYENTQESIEQIRTFLKSVELEYRFNSPDATGSTPVFPVRRLPKRERQRILLEKLHEEAAKNGTLTADGRLSSCPYEERLKRKSLIEESGVNLMEYGYMSKLIKVTGLSKRVIENTLKFFGIDHFQRRSSVRII